MGRSRWGSILKKVDTKRVGPWGRHDPLAQQRQGRTQHTQGAVEGASWQRWCLTQGAFLYLILSPMLWLHQKDSWYYTLYHVALT